MAVAGALLLRLTTARASWRSTVEAAVSTAGHACGSRTTPAAPGLPRGGSYAGLFGGLGGGGTMLLQRHFASSSAEGMEKQREAIKGRNRTRRIMKRLEFQRVRAPVQPRRCSPPCHRRRCSVLTGPLPILAPRATAVRVEDRQGAARGREAAGAGEGRGAARAPADRARQLGTAAARDVPVGAGHLSCNAATSQQMLASRLLLLERVQHNRHKITHGLTDTH